MIEKALIVIIFMYSLSFSLLGGQYVMDTFGIEMVSYEGNPIRSNLLSIVDTDSLSSVTNNLNTINGTATEADPISTAAGLVVDILELMTGTYIFNLLFLFGVPPIFIYGLITLYAILLFRAFVGYLRGV